MKDHFWVDKFWSPVTIMSATLDTRVYGYRLPKIRKRDKTPLFRTTWDLIGNSVDIEPIYKEGKEPPVSVQRKYIITCPCNIKKIWHPWLGIYQNGFFDLPGFDKEYRRRLNDICDDPRYALKEGLDEPYFSDDFAFNLVYKILELNRKLDVRGFWTPIRAITNDEFVSCLTNKGRQIKVTASITGPAYSYCWSMPIGTVTMDHPLLVIRNMDCLLRKHINRIIDEEKS